MSRDLRDFRGKITPITDAWLEAESRLTGRDKTDIVREVLDAHATRRLREATVLVALARAEGLCGEDEGGRGNAVGRTLR
jgi:hypothetical protein